MNYITVQPKAYPPNRAKAQNFKVGGEVGAGNKKPQPGEGLGRDCILDTDAATGYPGERAGVGPCCP